MSIYSTSKLLPSVGTSGGTYVTEPIKVNFSDSKTPGNNVNAIFTLNYVGVEYGGQNEVECMLDFCITDKNLVTKTYKAKPNEPIQVSDKIEVPKNDGKTEAYCVLNVSPKCEITITPDSQAQFTVAFQ